MRAEEAEQTRRRILDALAERLRQAPAEPVRVDQIARAARVPRSAVYLACWLLTSFDASDVLYTGRSLPAGQVAAILTTTAERALCQDT